MNRTKILRILQLGICLSLCYFIIFTILSNSTKDISREKVESKMLSKAKDLDSLEAGSTQDIRKYLGIDPSSYEWVIYYTSAGIMNVSELVIVKAGNSAALDSAEKGVQSRLDEQINNFTGYGTNQLELLNNAVCLRIGDYYFYAVSDNSDQWEEIFLDLVLWS